MGKIVMCYKEFFKCKKATITLSLHLMFSIISSIVAAQQILVVTQALEHYKELDTYIIPVITVTLGMMISNAASNYFRRLSHATSYTDMNNRFSKVILGLDYDVFTQKSTSHIVTTFEHINNFSRVTLFTCDLLHVIIGAVVIIVYMARIDNRVVAPILFIYTIATCFIRVLYNKFDKNHSEEQKGKAKRNQEIDEMINGFVEVRSFRNQPRHMSSISSQNKNLMDLMESNRRISFSVSLIIQAVDLIAVIIAIKFSCQSIAAGTITAAAAMSLVMYTWQLQQPLTSILDIMDGISECAARINDFDELMKSKPMEDGSFKLNSFQDEIKFENVSFKYNDSDSVLEDVSFTIKKGQHIGICGPSGGGKSTIMKLIPKFYGNYTGEISVDGINMRDISSDTLRRHIGIVSQENHIFNDTIYNNIAYAQPNCTETDVIEACKNACLYGFIQDLPDKFNTIVGPKGLKLSGGQKQRIALARIFLLNPEIILLDEATSALDNDSEKIIQESLSNFKDKTIIAVAHRLSTIKKSDQIFVVDKHHIVEHGTHDQLMSHDGVYKHLYSCQEGIEKPKVYRVV